MRSRLLTFTLIVSVAATCAAQRNSLTPYDFRPLTSLPWTDSPEAPMESLLKRIYLETNLQIRRQVLEAYLRFIPVHQMEAALDSCMDLEGTQWPEDLMLMFLPIWAQRDPEAAWKRTQAEFSLVTGFDWLGLDRWKNPKIEPADLAALRRSRHWLAWKGLETFPAGVGRSELPSSARIALLKSYAHRYLETFAKWPVGHSPISPRSSPLHADIESVFTDFIKGESGYRKWAEAAVQNDDYGTLEVILRRWLAAHPKDAPAIVLFAFKVGSAPSTLGSPRTQLFPSDELLLLWSQLDTSSMIRWVESADLPTGDVNVRAKGVLMALVDASTQKRWLKAASQGETTSSSMTELLSQWARWDPHRALAEAVKTDDFETLHDTAHAAVYGFDSSCYNRSHCGLGALKDLQLQALSAEGLGSFIAETLTVIMEQWGEVDAGEAARFGVQLLPSLSHPPRAKIIRFFAGDDSELAGEDGMVDRTFCALRTWAVLQPNDMKAWIATVKEEDMRQALTWLLENPWGTGEEESAGADLNKPAFNATER